MFRRSRSLQLHKGMLNISSYSRYDVGPINDVLISIYTPEKSFQLTVTKTQLIKINELIELFIDNSPEP